MEKMEKYFKSLTYLPALLWKKIRSEQAELTMPKNVKMSSRSFEIKNISFEDISFFEYSQVEYELHYYEGVLKEKIRIIHQMERVDVEWSENVDENEFDAFFRTIQTYYGFIYSGQFPNHVGMDAKKTEDTLRKTLETEGIRVGLNNDIHGKEKTRLYARYFPNGHYTIGVIGDFYEKIPNEIYLLSVITHRIDESKRLLNDIHKVIEKNKLRNLFSGQQ